MCTNKTVGENKTFCCSGSDFMWIYEHLSCLFFIYQSKIHTFNSLTNNIFSSNQKQTKKKIFIFILDLDLEDKFGEFY